MKTQKPKIILASVSIGRKQLLTKLGVDFEIIPSTIDEDAITHSNPIKMLQMRSKAKVEDVVYQLTHPSLSLQKRGYFSPFEKGERLRGVNQESLDANLINTRPYLIIAADSMAILRKPFGFAQGKTYGKAKDKQHAKEIISELMGPPATSGEAWRAGKTHEFVTSTSIVYMTCHPGTRSQKATSDLPAQAGRILRNINKDSIASSDTRQYLTSLQNDKDIIIKYWNDLTITKVTFKKLSFQELEDYVSRYDFTRFAAGYSINEAPWDLVTKIDGSYTNVIGLPFEVILPIFRKFEII